MYLHRIKLKNTGPIESVDIKCHFNADGSPKPIILVGQNGSGKSIVTAHIVNALIAAKAEVFDDSDVNTGNVYKLRSPAYIRQGADYSTAEIEFSDGLSVYEAQFLKPKNQYIEPFPNYPKWNEVPPTVTSHFTANFPSHRDILKKHLNNDTHIFFPPNRFEEPGWLNEENLRNKANYASLKNYTNYSNRPVIINAPMRHLQNWLLDLIYDCNAKEKKDIVTIVPQGPGKLPLRSDLTICDGPASKILIEISKMLNALFQKSGNIKWDIGSRNRRTIGAYINNESIIPNLFQLSTGQSVLLDLFLTIIRDFDLSHSELTQLSDIKGIVVVDEIDLHLHTDLQHDLLPVLIHLFPKIQFILTTHSPLFLMGMKRTFPLDGFQLIELPNGQNIEVERFSEFEAAYQHMRTSARFQDDVRTEIEKSQKPIIYLEGTTDIDYLRKAAELLEKTNIINQFKLLDAVGYSQLDKIWSAYKSDLGKTIQQTTVLLYDCDTNKSPEQSGKVFRRTIPKQNHKITSGIENLFPDSTIQKAINSKPAFIDITGEYTATQRGKKISIPEQWAVNKDEKRNLCDWLCKNGNLKDFENFSLVFDIIEEFILNN